MKKEYRLNGLSCANCALKIEEDISHIEGVEEVRLDFLTQKLLFELKDPEKEKGIQKEIFEIAKSHESNIKVETYTKENFLKEETIVLKGLDCANCALKIEEKVSNLHGVEEVSLNFVSKKLKYTRKDAVNKKDIQKQISKIVKGLEPDVQVISEEDEYLHEDDEHDVSSITRLIFGSSIFLLTLLFPLSNPIKIGLYVLAYLVIGYKVIWQSIQGITRGQVFDENFLMTIATLGAFAIGEYPEAVGVMLFYLVGEIFQDRAVDQSRKSISNLMNISPDFAIVKRQGVLYKVNPDEVALNEIIVVKPGEKIPLDGLVIQGESLVDTSALTGESVPKRLEKDSQALSGFVNGNGLLEIKVEKKYEESTVAKILDLVENASSKKAPTEQFITKFAKYYTPLVVFSALGLAILVPLLFQEDFSKWIYRALVFLVISCPCALVISIPLGFFGGIGSASKQGILVKGGNYLEALNFVEQVIFDKTGTLTKGVFDVQEIFAENGFEEEEILKIAAYGESQSNHPIAKSIVAKYNKEIDRSQIQNYNEISGHGIQGKIFNKEVLIGNKKLMDKFKIEFNESNVLGTIIYIALERKFIGWISIADEVKEDSAEAIKKLKALGVKSTILLTGDVKARAEEIGQSLGVDSIYSELLPEDKVHIVEKIEKEKKNKETIVYVGDGINDAPVLARTDVGVAMGGLGSDAAIEAADIVIMTDEPSKIATALLIARKTRKIVIQNIIFALVVKFLFLLMGALGYTSMWAAVFADVGVALIAILNSIRTLNIKG